MKLRELVLTTRAFRDRQYKSGKVLALRFKYVPKTNQLYTYAHVGSGSDPTKHYKVLIVFNQIKSSENRSKVHNMKLDQDEVTYYLTRPTLNSNIMVRCSDPGFRHEFHWHDAKYKALVGPKIPYTRVPGSNRPPKNPKQIPGLCKHLIQLILKLMAVRVITDKSNSAVMKYITQKPKPVN